MSPICARSRSAAVLTASTLMLVLSSTSTARAQFDHLTCFKAKDSLAFSADVTLDMLQDQFEPPGGCRLIGKATLFCVPTSKTVDSFQVGKEPGALLDVPGPEPVPDRICYKVKCPRQEIPAELVHDQFGAREISKFKTRLLCTPAVKGAPPTTTTTTLQPENCMAEMIPGQGIGCYGFCAGECGCATGGSCVIAVGMDCNVSSDCPPYQDTCSAGLCSIFATSCTTNADCVIADGCACNSMDCSCF